MLENSFFYCFDGVSYAKGDAAMQVSIYDTKVSFSEEREKALIAQGIKQEKIRTILVMHSDGMPLEKIAKYSKFSVDEVEMIIKENS